MKQYFAKWLPIEGEIKEGDFANFDRTDLSFDYDDWKDGIPWKCVKVEEDGYRRYALVGSPTGRQVSVPSMYSEKKVELFLCSRDIQVGDKAYNINNVAYGAWPVSESEIPDCIEWEGEAHSGQYLFKVVGEISSNAIWVKEGDEFDEEDVKKYIFRIEDHQTYPQYSYNMIRDWPKSHPEIYSIGVRIKCPTCKTFH